MKRVLALVLCLLVLLGCSAIAEDVKTSYQAETVLMPGIYLQMSVPVGIRAEYMDTPFFQVQYDLGTRYDGGNDDLHISVWCFNNLGAVSGKEFAQSYGANLGYEVNETELNGWPAFHLWRSPEPTSDGYLLTDESEQTDPNIAYTIFFTTYSDAGVALRDEIISTIRSASF